MAVGRHQRYLDPSRADHEEGVGVVALDDDRRAGAVVRRPTAAGGRSTGVASSIAMKLFGPTAVSEPTPAEASAGMMHVTHGECVTCCGRKQGFRRIV